MSIKECFTKILSVLTFLFLSSTFTLFAQDHPKGIEVNQDAPDFMGKDQNGKEIKLKTLLEKGEVIVLFYRGQWCPYCNKQLSNLQDSLKMITSKGATVIAITPEKQENIAKTIEKTKAAYSIIYDEGLTIMKSYKVDFQLDKATIDKYKTYKIDLNNENGPNGNNLPIPAVYIIDQKGKITYRYFDKDYSKRPSVKEIVKNLK